MPEMVLSTLPATTPGFSVYVYTLLDVPGVVAQNNYVSFFNPANSGKVMVALAGIVSTYAVNLAASPNSLATRRITGASGGSLVTASTVPRFQSVNPDPVVQVRTGNPTITGAGLPLSAFPPVISDKTGSPGTQTSPAGAPSFVCLPGEGLVWNTAAGDVNQIWNITFLWGESGFDMVKG